MKKIEFEYSTGWRRCKHVVNLPSTLSEATTAQFLTLLRFSQGEISEEKFFCDLFGINEKVLAKLDPYQLYVIGQEIRSLWDVDSTDSFFIDSIKVGKTVLAAPSKQLKGMPFQQFMTVDQFYQWYAYTQKTEYLNAMIAALYLPAYADFFTYEHAKFTDLLAYKGDYTLMEGIALNWALIREWLSRSYPFLFPPAAAEGDGKDQTQKKKARPGSWLNIFDALVGDDLTRIETYRTLPTMDVIRILNKRIKQQQK